MSNPIPSATVVVLREVDQSLEVLLLKRNSKIAYGGMWVFPGGKIDMTDFAGEKTSEQGREASLQDVEDGSYKDHPEMLIAAQNAAHRETQEEAGLHIEHDKLIYFAHWTTPKIRPKRFSTWFFIAPAETHEVTIDGGEIHEHCWRSPEDALRAHREGEIELVPPTFITLLSLLPYKSIGAVEEHFSKQPLQIFEPRVEMLPEGLCYFYQGDVGYESTDHRLQGARHRLYANNNKDWVYQRSV